MGRLLVSWCHPNSYQFPDTFQCYIRFYKECCLFQSLLFNLSAYGLNSLLKKTWNKNLFTNILYYGLLSLYYTKLPLLSRILYNLGVTQKSWFQRNRFCRVTPAKFIRYLKSFYKANLDINKPLRLWVFIYT